MSTPKEVKVKCMGVKQLDDTLTTASTKVRPLGVLSCICSFRRALSFTALNRYVQGCVRGNVAVFCKPKARLASDVETYYISLVGKYYTVGCSARGRRRTLTLLQHRRTLSCAQIGIRCPASRFHSFGYVYTVPFHRNLHVSSVSDEQGNNAGAVMLRQGSVSANHLTDDLLVRDGVGWG